MPWVKIDDQYSEHPKTLMAGAIGVAIHVSSLCYCSRHLTDGFFPKNALPLILSIIDGPGIIPEMKAMNWPQIMIDCGLWERTEKGFFVHDYLDYNPAKDKILSERKAKKEAGQKGAKLRWGGDGTTDSRSHNRSDGTTYGTSGASAIGNSMPPSHTHSRSPSHTRTRPDPKSNPLSGEEPDHTNMDDGIPYSEILDHLNNTIGANPGYRPSSRKNREIIKARWNEGFRLDDFKIVHTKKAGAWLGTEWAKFLRPITLYGTKFESYLNEIPNDSRFSETTAHNLKVLSEWAAEKKAKLEKEENELN